MCRKGDVGQSRVTYNRDLMQAVARKMEGGMDPLSVERVYGITFKTAYKWRKRAKEEGWWSESPDTSREWLCTTGA